MDFDMFFGVSIFDRKWGFIKGYSLCMMADFQNGLISRIFGVFSSGFLHRRTLKDCTMDIDMFFGISIFDPKWRFCKSYSLCMMADFQNGRNSRIFGVFSSGFLHRTTVNDL